MGTVILAGNATGIGLAALRGFLARGDRVLVAGTGPDPAEAMSTPDDVLRRSPRDLADADAPRAMVAEAVAAFGGLDTVVVTAAMMHAAPLDGWTAAMWDEAAALNLRLPFLLAQAAAPHLARSANPSILFLSSTATLRGSAGAAAFQATKAGLPALARSLTAELGPAGIRVNCILPGWIETAFSAPYWAAQPDPAAARAAVDDAIPLGRHGDAAEVAAMILFLSSPAGRYVAGTAIVIDGGYTAT